MTTPDGGAKRDPAQRARKVIEAGKKELQTILDSLAPELLAGDYVFCSVAGAAYGDYVETAPIACCHEREGLTLVMLKESADQHGLAYGSTYRCISLGVHSSLDGVGLTAAVSARLSSKRISANVIAAYFHDHIFVPSSRADEALAALLGMESGRNGKDDGTCCCPARDGMP